MTENCLSIEAITQACQDQGLSLMAIIEAPAQLNREGFEKTIENGVGDMQWLEEQDSLRHNPDELFPGVQRIMMASLPYAHLAPDEQNAASLKRARYAANKDYHNLFRKKLAAISKQWITKNNDIFPSRAFVDSAPVNERQLAQIAGLGWIGKNALLLHPKQGSYHFLGSIFTAAPLPLLDGGARNDRCGNCTKCEVACPTQALHNRQVKSTRCISYLTIEHQGVIPRELAQHFQGWWYGCDICQEVCPWNRFAPGAADERLSGDFDNEALLLSLDAAGFEKHFAGRAVRRISYERFRRNLLVALWSLDRHEAYALIINEGLDLVLAQARELGITV